jgi:acyl-coenzyme A synthetase/AMP-(fatty) acid ligase
VSRESLLAALRERVDAAFLPRRILRVESLPRDPTGKLPAGRLSELVTQLLSDSGHA